MRHTSFAGHPTLAWEDGGMDVDNDCASGTIGNYIIHEKLNSGTFSQVRRGIHVYTGQEVALKILKAGQFVENEVACWKRVYHSNVAMLFEHIDGGTQVIVMQLVNGKDLYGIIEQAKGGLSELKSKAILFQLCLAVQACHEAGVAHRDIKLENVLLDKQGYIYLCDFGLAKEINDDLLADYCGSTEYTAPEVLRNIPYDGRLSDAWSVGVVMYALLRGCLPFSDDPRMSCGSAEDNDRAVKIQVLEGVYHQPDASPEAIDLLHHVLCPVQGRWSIPKILDHPWLQTVHLDTKQLPDPYLTAKALVEIGFDALAIDQCLVQRMPNSLYGLIHILAHKRHQRPRSP